MEENNKVKNVDFLAGYLYKCFEEVCTYGSDEEKHYECIPASWIPKVGRNTSNACATIIEMTLEELKKRNEGKSHLEITAAPHLHFIKFTLTITAPKKKMTVSEIEEKLGYPIEIIAEHEVN